MLCAVRGWSELRSNWIISNIRTERAINLILLFDLIIITPLKPADTHMSAWPC
jgi:hypothetical protein